MMLEESTANKSTVLLLSLTALRFDRPEQLVSHNHSCLGLPIMPCLASSNFYRAKNFTLNECVSRVNVAYKDYSTMAKVTMQHNLLMLNYPLKL